MPQTYTAFNIETHEIVGRLSHIPQTGMPDGQDWIFGDFDDRLYFIDPYGASDVDEKGNQFWIPTPYLKPEPRTQAELKRDIIKERKRRQSLGFDFDFATIPGGDPADPRGVHHIGTTPEDLAGWDEVSKFADICEKLGQSDQLIDIDTDTGPVQIKASEWKFILLAAGQFRQPLWKRASELSYMTPIPQNVVDRVYWEDD